MHRVLTVGLPRELFARLADRLPRVVFDRADRPRELPQRLGDGPWSLVLVHERDAAANETAGAEASCEAMLRALASARAEPAPPVLCCVRAGTPAGSPRRRLERYPGVEVLRQPIGEEQLARAVATRLGVEAERPAQLRERERQEHEQMAALWTRFRAHLLERAAVLEQAATALRERRPALALRRRAEREAHRLAGAVGTFGLTDATRWAREAERLLAGEHPVGEADAHRLAQLAAALRRRIDTPFPPAPPA